MRSFQTDLELTILHMNKVEARLAAQRAKIAVMRAVGHAEDGALHQLAKSLEYLKKHRANITAPAARH